ncbi:MAG: flagellar hook-basal body complex protein [Candidatus Gastranaerophilales bacterium]|nr:flagellar hook-basal body complex protein [Candidatus Gastranaerophilales bacterium]
MTQSLFTSITGMTTSQTKLDVIANNIANMNTTAFKSSNLTFSELYSKTLSSGSSPTSTSGGTNPMQVGLGVGLSGISTDFTAGSVQSTGNTNDLNIQGVGWFTILNSDGTVGLTRDGSFALDSSGNLVTQSGLKVLGTGTSYSTTGSKTPIKVPNELDIIMSGKNITSGDAGNLQNLNNAKITTGTSTMTINSTEGSEIASITVDTDGAVSVKEIANIINDEIKKHPELYKEGTDEYLIKAQVNTDGTFSIVTNKVDGLDEVSDIKFGKTGDTSNLFSETELSIAPMEDGKYTSKILSYQIDIGPATSSTASVSKTNFAVTENGALSVTYSNGDSITVEEDNGNVVLKYCTADGKTIKSKDITVSGGAITPSNLQIQLASVVNEQGLKAQQGNIYISGANSGALTFSIGNSNGFGEIGSGGLELSNVNLAIELANMIVAQRAIDANSRVFSSTSEVLQRLVSLQ